MRDPLRSVEVVEMHALGVAMALLWVAVSPARADAYAWGGELGRVSVHVSISGFNDGAGEGGWRPENARWFASWARRIDAMLPPGARVEIGNTGADEPIVITMTGSHAARLETGLARAFPGELDALLGPIAAELGVRVAPARDAPLYTIQLLAARDPIHASRLADATRPEVGEVFYETCLPCGPAAAHVLDGPSLQRVVVGLYPDRAHAQRDLRRLRALVPGAFVRAL